MRKISSFLAATGIWILLLCGCSAEKSLPEMTTIDPEKIVETAFGMPPCLESRPTLSLYEGYSSDIVYGEVLGMEYEEGTERLRTSKVYVQVFHSIKGECEEGDIINVSIDQELEAADVFYHSPGCYDYQKPEIEKYTEEELADLYVQYVEFSDIAPVVGQKNIYLLSSAETENEAEPDEIKTYNRVGGPDSSYTEVEEGRFVNTGRIGSFTLGNYHRTGIELEEIGDAYIYSMYELIDGLERAENGEECEFM